MLWCIYIYSLEVVDFLVMNEYHVLIISLKTVTSPNPPGGYHLAQTGLQHPKSGLAIVEVASGYAPPVGHWRGLIGLRFLHTQRLQFSPRISEEGASWHWPPTVCKRKRRRKGRISVKSGIVGIKHRRGWKTRGGGGGGVVCYRRFTWVIVLRRSYRSALRGCYVLSVFSLGIADLLPMGLATGIDPVGEYLIKKKKR